MKEKKDNPFDISWVNSTYIPNLIENQCLFCNNKVEEGHEICVECRISLDSDRDFEN